MNSTAEAWKSVVCSLRAYVRLSERDAFDGRRSNGIRRHALKELARAIGLEDADEPGHAGPPLPRLHVEGGVPVPGLRQGTG